MDTKTHSSFLPLHVDESIDAFRVDGTMAVRALVRELIGNRALVAVYAEEDPDTFIVTRILALEADSLEMDFSGDEARLQALLRAPYLTVVGAPGSVKIQFRIAEVEFAGRIIGKGKDSGGVLTAPLPSTGWRVQRRNAFRVRPPQRDQAVVIFRLPGGVESRGRLTDLSVGGLAAFWQSDEPQAELGTTLRNCRIEANDIAPIPCDLRIVRVDRDGDAAPAHLSCEFYAMPHAVARFVQLYVMDIEKRARLALRKA